MPYTAFSDRRMPWDNDGTVLLLYDDYPLIGANQAYPSGANCLALNGYTGPNVGHDGTTMSWPTHVLFFPEQREVTAMWYSASAGIASGISVQDVKGSNDTVNGVDGTWETASYTPPAGVRHAPMISWDQWRSEIFPISFTGGKRTIRLRTHAVNPGGGGNQLSFLHVYGEKVAGQTPDDVIYINHDDTPGVEYTAPEDFGDQPLGTTVVRQFRVKNASATKTANTVNIQCNDSDFAISTDNVNWVATINIASLAAGAQSATMYVRCTTPAAGNALGPRFARIITTVASYT
jgi:hypothetical protein